MPIDLAANGDADRVVELTSELQALRQQLELERLETNVRERELCERLGTALISEFRSELTSGMTALQGSIECAVHEVLLPFMGQEVGRRATDELSILIRETLANSSGLLLEAKAPSHLHRYLQPCFQEAGLVVELTESTRIELTFDSQRRHFEELSTRWITMISELDP
ncbi:MAG: hypothetical protein WCN98_07700 [Verrucomicrobiaceae bacterium]